MEPHALKDPISTIQDYARDAMRTHHTQLKLHRAGKSFPVQSLIMGAVMRRGQGTINPELAATLINDLVRDPAEPRGAAEVLAMRYHESYETEATRNLVGTTAGYDPREPWGAVPELKRKCMIATMQNLIDRGIVRV